MKKDKLHYYVIFVATFLLFSIQVLLADPYFPPTATSLLQKEHDSKQQTMLADLEKVVEKVMQKRRGKKRRKSKNARKKSKKVKKNRKKKLQKLANQKATISQELRYLLQQQYHDKTLQKTISVRLQEIDIIAAIRLITKMADIEIVIDADVVGKVHHFNFKRFESIIVY